MSSSSNRTATPPRATPRDDQKWQSVVACDKGADGTFLYAVVTTGVYCLPSCRSRTPLRDNVRYFASSHEAERAGYRPCKRCNPDQHARRSHTSSHIALVQELCRSIEAEEKVLTLAELAGRLERSASFLRRVFEKETGITPKRYALLHRQERLRRRLLEEGTVTSVMREVGYTESGRFCQHAKRALGMTARDYRAGGTDVKAQYAVAKSSLGYVLVAASEVGVCAVFLGDQPKPLIQSLVERFPRAELRPGDQTFHQLIGRIVSLVENPRMAIELPLDLRGTLFQKRVWCMLQKIPLGQRWTYGQIAQKLGQPSASRAVAGACAKNPVALLVPCHRVVRSDGVLSGYRWGVSRKRALLEREQDL